MDKDPRIVRLLNDGSFHTRVAGRGTFTLNFCPHCARCLADSISDIGELDDAVHVIQHTSCKTCMEQIKALLR
jgi:hypothetical protein